MMQQKLLHRNDNRTGPRICCTSLIFSQVYGPIWLKNLEKYKNVFTCVSELVKFFSSFKYCNYNFLISQHCCQRWPLHELDCLRVINTIAHYTHILLFIGLKPKRTVCV
ncbi:unnamed protein product [Meganyctiphanes norvegica]|uniref:Uncharacterized protein n=1 Tax=Meganyctiphanes norvegica TaxID=48144 RepID=A0AAV2R8L4_MEGNR